MSENRSVSKNISIVYMFTVLKKSVNIDVNLGQTITGMIRSCRRACLLQLRFS